jgi:hypothetical protein
VAGSPAMVVSGSLVEIAAVNGTMGFWYANLANLTWHLEQVPAPALTPSPALVRTPRATRSPPTRTAARAST